MEIPGYHIDKIIGKGGMASVYLATQISLERLVVLKILDLSKQPDDAGQIERFLAEGRIVASLNHPNIITIYDIGVADNNALYISMEYIKGGDLKSRIGIPMDPYECLDYLIKVSNGLKVAHEHGIIHRDVKPANILFRDDKTPLLTDFGIAKQINRDLNLTSTGIFLGSPNYVSPEQASGADIDHRTDIYSLGCIFYEMLTGEKPFKADTVFDVVMKHKNAPIPVLPEDLSRYQNLLNTMMAKNRYDRYESVGAMIEVMEDLLGRHKPAMGILDFDIPAGQAATKEKSNKKIIILSVLLFLSALFFGSLQYLDIRLKKPAVDLDAVSINTTLDTNINPATLIKNTSDDNNKTDGQETPVSQDVINALEWLGSQSLEEYRLTYPPKDNAYYYFSRLLEIDPENETARNGFMEIADRYAVLAEKALANNDFNKSEAYIKIGMKINPQNETLLSLEKLNQETRHGSFIETLKGFFK